MVLWLVFISLFLLLLWSKHQLSHQLFITSMLSTGKSRPGVYLYALFFLPGTIVHELSHLLMATFLGVHTGHISLFPHFDRSSQLVRLGSVEVASTDLLRQSLIGLAPTLVGISLIAACSQLFFPVIFQFPDSALSVVLTHFISQPFIPSQLFALYLIFTLSNTLHTSRSDRQTWVPLLLLITPFVIFFSTVTDLPAIFTGFPLDLNFLLFRLVISFLFALMINLIMVILFFLINLSFSSLTGRRIVFRSSA